MHQTLTPESIPFRKHTVFKAFATWRSIRRATRELYNLSDRELTDIGLVRGEIESVVRQAFEAERNKPVATARVRAETGVKLGGRGLSGLQTQA